MVPQSIVSGKATIASKRNFEIDLLTFITNGVASKLLLLMGSHKEPSFPDTKAKSSGAL